MNLTLKSISTTTCSIGKLYADGEFICYILENPWLDNQPNISCIPSGNYEIQPHISPKYDACYAVVGGSVGISEGERTHILIHVGNTEEDTNGCLLPGSSTGVINGNVAVLNSRAAYNKLMDLLDGYNHTLAIERV